ncbi:MAG: hypothetical protein EOP22_14965 [Hyphomicrobiales bacterium]|nr:MAG: hypothetical protein EOP22_14965 [Hyphomicrobiales bacterium]
MQGRYPRTIAEFAAQQRAVLVCCTDCQRRRHEPNDVLDAIFGADFDLYAGYSILVATLRCDACGKKHREVLFQDERPAAVGTVGFAEEMDARVERAAYLRMRRVG